MRHIRLVHGDIRRLENCCNVSDLVYSVHGDIRRLESHGTSGKSTLDVHGDIRRLEMRHGLAIPAF